MGVLHGWALVLGAAAVALPVVVHFLTRPRPVTLALSTIRFVHEAVRQRRARHRLRDFLVLLLRTLAVILIAWAFARPLLGQLTSMLAEDHASRVRVVILDVSQSMGAMSRGVQLLERARPIASQFLTDAGETKVNLILAGAAPRPVFDQPTGNVAALRDELTRVQSRPERLNLQTAINVAAQQFAKSTSSDKEMQYELIVVSDFQRTNWTAVDFKPLPQNVRIKLESVAPAEPLANVAITRVGAPGRQEQGRDSRIEVEVANYSPAARQVHVEVTFGTSSQRLQGLCPPYGKSVLTAETSLRTPGWHSGEARLLDVQDALSGDNVRPFVLDVRAPPSYVLVTRQPLAVRGSSYYLERGLFPSINEQQKKEPRLKRIEASQIDRENLGAAEVVLLDHPGRLSAEAVQVLANALRRGKGMFYVVTELADATNLRGIADVLKTDLQMPVMFVPPGPNERRRGLFLTDVRRDRPPFSIFGDGLPAMVEPLRFTGGLPTRRTEQGLTDDVLATFNDGTSGLVVTSCGAGTLAIFNADLAASNVTASSAFVPILGELMDRLLGQQRQAETLCGEPQAVYLPASAGVAAGLQPIGPPGAGDELGQIKEETNGGVLWSVPRLNKPGVYRVQRNGQSVFELACVLSPDESDLRPIDPNLLKNRLAGGRTIAFHDAARPDDAWENFWVWLAFAAALCLIGELVVLKIFRS